MNRSIKRLLRKFLFERKQRKAWQKVVTALAAIVVFCTTYALILPAITLENTKNFIYEDETIIVKAALPLETEVPEDAVLSVQTITETDESYIDLTNQVKESIEGETEEIVLYDISFYTVENEYIPVSEDAMVSFEFKETIITQGEGEVAVFHYEEGLEQPKQLENITVETTEEDVLSSVTFQTEGFSIFAVVKISQNPVPDPGPDSEPEEEELYVNDLGGQKFAIVNYQNEAYAMTTTPSAINGRLESQRVQFTVSDYIYSDTDITVWSFESIGNTTGRYYISTTVENGSLRYLSISDNSNQISLSDTPAEITVTAFDNGKVMLRNGNKALDFYMSDGRTFSAWNRTSNANQQQSLYRLAPEETLIYNLNLGGNHDVTQGENLWGSMVPALEENTQKINGQGAKLYKVLGDRNDAGYFNYNLYMEEGNADTSNLDDQNAHIAKFLKEQGQPYGKEFRFDGWSTVIDGTEYLFPEEADAVQNEDGVLITDINGNQINVPSGTMLTGKWTEIADTALFFVNYSGTVLDTEADVTGRNQREFTPCVGIGRIYHGKENFGSDETFTQDANQDIQASFVKTYDPNNSEVQVVMQYVAYVDERGVYRFDKFASGINQSEFSDYVLKYIRDREETIRISTEGNINNPPIRPENADAEHYQVRWYIMKEQVDAWHIDGILVAKTDEIEIVKNVYGLENRTDLLNSLMNNFSIDLKLNDEDYITLHDQGIPGQYSFHGQIADGFHSYRWTLQMIHDELYTMTEQNYEVNGYDCTTSVIVRTKDQQEFTVYGQVTTDVASIKEYVEGLTVESVTFNNYYTPENRGTFAIVKRDATLEDNDKSNKLSGAVFLLEKKANANKYTEVGRKTTDANGYLTFSDLSTGTYRLTEITAPEGYILSNDIWTVVVSSNYIGGGITVTIKESNEADTTVCYSSKQLQTVYPIKNMPNNSTVTVVKEFTGITDSALEELKAESENPYSITLKNQDGEGDYELKLTDSSVTEQNKTFTWRIAGVMPGTYLVTEQNFYHKDYADVIVEASEQSIILDYEHKTASFETELELQESSNIRITNRYIDEYQLQVNIVDSDSPDIPLTGAVFEVYGSYGESTHTDRQVIYTDPDTDKTQTAYYLNSVTIQEGGSGVISGLKLSMEEKNYTYVLSEITAPDGYSLPTEPIVIKNIGPNTACVVSGAGAEISANYDNGMFKIKVPNTTKSNDRIIIEATKEWTGVFVEPEITLELYRSVQNETPKLVTGQTKTVNSSQAWKCTWTGLPLYDDYNRQYTYYVREGPLNNYETSYNHGVIDFKIDGQKISAGNVVFNSNRNLYEITIENQSGYQLPKTGGIGRTYFTLGGVLLIALSLLWGYKIKNERRRTE